MNHLNNVEYYGPVFRIRKRPRGSAAASARSRSEDGPARALPRSSPRTVIRGESPPSHTQLAFSIREFCEQHGISRAMFYILAKKGQAPRIMKVGGRTLVSIDAAAEWRRKMEQATSAL
jgi:predicted DNA-binding transcriptional regulator AlpA